MTVAVFAFDGFDQRDMDSFADWFSLPRFTPEVVGGMPSQPRGEATMDIQLIHAIAPAAKDRSGQCSFDRRGRRGAM